MHTINDFPKKDEFPADLQKFYFEEPKPFNEFNEDFGLVCLLVGEEEINNQRDGIFSRYEGKRPDQVHYSIGIGLVEEKSTNYGKSRIENQFSEFKKYFEQKYGGNKFCKVKYFILYAPVLSEKLKKELSINKNNHRLVHANKKSKQFNINNVPVYFMKKNR